MKIPRIFVALISLALLAAGSLPRHQAFGPLRFGMTSNDAATAVNHLHHGSKAPMTAAEARTQFVTSGSGMRMARMADFDRACQVFLSYKADPFLKSITIAAQGKPAEGYDTFVKQTWEDFQDIGDCKFQRKGSKGTFPLIASVNGETKEVVTDVWEIEGVRIELSVHYFDPSTSPGAAPGPPRYNAELTAMEIAPPQ